MPDLHAALRAGVDQAGVGVGTPALADGAGGDHGDRRIDGQAQQGAVAGVLVLEGGGPVPQGAGGGQFGLQPAVLGDREEIVAHARPDTAQPADRGGEGAGDRGDDPVGGLAQGVVGAFLVGLAAVGHQEGEGHDEGDHARRRRAQQQGQPHLAEGIVPERHGPDDLPGPRPAGGPLMCAADQP